MKKFHSIKRTAQRGFTLIELMIVVAIIGILAAVGLPMYKDYTLKAKVAEGPSLAANAMTAIGVACSLGSLADIDNTGKSSAEGALAPDASIKGKYVSQVTAKGSAAGATVTIVYSGSGAPDEIKGKKVTYVGTCVPGAGLTWRIDQSGTDAVPEKYQPKL